MFHAHFVLGPRGEPSSQLTPLNPRIYSLGRPRFPETESAEIVVIGPNHDWDAILYNEFKGITFRPDQDSVMRHYFCADLGDMYMLEWIDDDPYFVVVDHSARRSRGTDNDWMDGWFLLDSIVTDSPSEIPPRRGTTKSQNDTPRRSFFAVLYTVREGGNVIRTRVRH